jgi:hypothetical protein
MVSAPCATTVPVPPPAYHRAQAKVGPALHIDALTLVSGLHLLALCLLAVRLARRRCPPLLPAVAGGRAAIGRSRWCCWRCCARSGAVARHALLRRGARRLALRLQALGPLARL